MSENNSTQNGKQVPEDAAPFAEGMINTFISVLRQPAKFFSEMPRTGGIGQPLVFMIVISVISGLVRALLGLTGLLPGLETAMALASIILAPILITIFGFIVAAILFIIWKIMGSEHNFETAYRCIAYGSAISPVTQVLMAIPYLGIVLALAWWTFILVVASTKVHGIRQGVAATVFMIFAVLMAGFSVSAQYAGRRMEAALHNAQNNKQYSKDPAKAMRDLGNMLKQMGKTAQHQ